MLTADPRSYSEWCISESGCLPASDEMENVSVAIAQSDVIGSDELRSEDLSTGSTQETSTAARGGGGGGGDIRREWGGELL